MSKESGKTRTGRRQLSKTASRSGRRNLAEESPESMTLLSGRHSEQDLDAETLEIKAQVQEMTREAQRLREILAEFKCKPKTRFRTEQDLDPITEDDLRGRQTSSDEDDLQEQPSTNKLGSSDTLPYSQQGNPRISPLANHPSMLHSP